MVVGTAMDNRNFGSRRPRGLRDADDDTRAYDRISTPERFLQSGPPDRLAVLRHLNA
jgi:hypothetical protein